MQKRVLITGATGFVGSHILETLAGRDDLHVIAACRDPARLPALSGRVEVRVGDLRDGTWRKSLLGDVDVLCHAAAWTSLWGHTEDSRSLYLEPTLGLIEDAREAGVKRFINTSTTSAAAPDSSLDPNHPGIPRPFWPHLCNVIVIENELRAASTDRFQTINLRLGIFAGRRYALGLLPILAPRLKTHLVPWVAGGRTGMPIVDGRDIGQAFARALDAEGLGAHEGFNIVGPEIPQVRAVFEFLHAEFALPLPHFGVSFPVAYAFAWLMEKLDPLVPWEPLVTRSIIHLLEETHADNQRAERSLGYRPVHGWRDAIRAQMAEMAVRQTRPMSMAKAIG